MYYVHLNVLYHPSCSALVPVSSVHIEYINYWYVLPVQVLHVHTHMCTCTMYTVPVHEARSRRTMGSDYPSSRCFVPREQNPPTLTWRWHEARHPTWVVVAADTLEVPPAWEQWQWRAPRCTKPHRPVLGQKARNKRTQSFIKKTKRNAVILSSFLVSSSARVG